MVVNQQGGEIEGYVQRLGWEGRQQGGWVHSGWEKDSAIRAVQ